MITALLKAEPSRHHERRSVSGGVSPLPSSSEAVSGVLLRPVRLMLFSPLLFDPFLYFLRLLFYLLVHFLCLLGCLLRYFLYLRGYFLYLLLRLLLRLLLYVLCCSSTSHPAERSDERGSQEDGKLPSHVSPSPCVLVMLRRASATTKPVGPDSSPYLHSPRPFRTILGSLGNFRYYLASCIPAQFCLFGARCRRNSHLLGPPRLFRRKLSAIRGAKSN